MAKEKCVNDSIAFDMVKEKCFKDSLTFVARMIIWDERSSNLHSLDGSTFEGPSERHSLEAKTVGNLRVSDRQSLHTTEIRDNQM